ncbi:L-threonylcarbamoyladenylate synthase [Frateuria aurantia]
MTVRLDPAGLAEAGRQLREGAVIAYPTEAVYGLGCDPMNIAACERLYQLKQRPSNRPLLLIGSSLEMLLPYMDRSLVDAQQWQRILDSWPGPHTWIFPRSPRVADWVAGEYPGIALRWTAHPLASALCTAFGGPLVSTSANPHGQAPARSADEVHSYFGEHLDLILDGVTGGLERPSTIRDALDGRVLRS